MRKFLPVPSFKKSSKFGSRKASFRKLGLRLIFPGVFLILASLITISGCLSDPINGPQIFYHGVVNPTVMSRRDTLYNPATQTGSLVLRWQPTLTDTQLNFRGYYVALYKADSFQAYLIDTIVPASPTKLAYRDTIIQHNILTVTFTNIPLRQYIAAVWALQYSNPAKPDSLIKSIDSAGLTFFFDPRPVNHPTVVQAVSAGSQQVNLKWKLPACDTQSNVIGYQVYYKDPLPTHIHDTARVAASIPVHQDSAVVTVPASTITAGFSEYKYHFWVSVVRADSLVDSSYADGIDWSGAEQVTSGTGGDSIPAHNGLFSIPLGNAFIGAANGGYAIDSTTNSSANLFITQNGGGQVVVSSGGVGTTMFDPNGDTASDISQVYYSAPITDYSASSVTLPNSVTSPGYVIHIKLPDGSVARIFFLYGTGTTGTGFVTNGYVYIKASYQPYQTAYPYD
jgi:hypothetical protein